MVPDGLGSCIALLVLVGSRRTLSRCISLRIPWDTQQIWLSDWTADYPDPQDFLSLQFLPNEFYGTSSTTGAQDAMSLLSQADVDLDGPTRALEYQQAEQILVNQVAWIPLFQLHTPVGFRRNVANYAITASGLPSVETWQQVYITNL